ncbi:cytochrome c peroxidase [uncultured Roseobacter sp.]|uniref:cytochrome-c peroxidase n=1 Tax=uncultured Roseobacter sp. TaxID=114847 RepID=UPI0026325BDB|nr:cytochrome c peroxidase [uncultured Roseobacter sp.]
MKPISIFVAIGLSALTLSGNAQYTFAQTLPAVLEDRDFLWDGAPDPKLFDLGRDLFFDPILSGNRNIACGTCHDPKRGTGDGVALSIGEGGDGFGTDRHTVDPVTGRVPRNAQALYNVGARAYGSFFHDGRLEVNRMGGFPSRLRSPAGKDLPEGISNALTAQAMFPVLSSIEMAGQPGENAVADAVAQNDVARAWRLLANRLAQTQGYADRFVESFPEIAKPQQIEFRHAAEALAAFQSVAFRSDQSPFDARLEGASLSSRAEAGLQLFYGKARCSNCHSGPLLTDHGFHAIAVPQIGPGKGHGDDGSYAAYSGFEHRTEDHGRASVTGNSADRFRFRTPSLRNVALTGPWGHDGAFDTMESMVRHHLDPSASLKAYLAVALLPLDHAIQPVVNRSSTSFRMLDPALRPAFDLRDVWVHTSPRLQRNILQANELAPVALTEQEIGELLAFLNSLTDPTARDRSHLVPETVPSGLDPQPRYDRH